MGCWCRAGGLDFARVGEVTGQQWFTDLPTEQLILFSANIATPNYKYAR